MTRTLGGAFGGQLAATLLADNLAGGGLPASSGFTLSFLMCLIALAGALGFSFAVPRRSADDAASGAEVHEPVGGRELERAAA